MKKTVQEGDTVKVHYTGTLENGTVFDSSKEEDPLQFTVGKQQVVKGFDNAVLGMTISDTKKVTLLPEEAYGHYDEKLVIEMPKDTLPQDLTLEVGMGLQLIDDKENKIPVKVTEILDKSIKIDANPPLAGKVLNFEIELIEIM